MPKRDPLSDEEQRLFFSLLRRVCENHIDQWLMMRMHADPFEWYIDIALAPPAGADYADEYFPVDEETRLTDHSVPPPYGQLDS